MRSFVSFECNLAVDGEVSQQLYGLTMMSVVDYINKGKAAHLTAYLPVGGRPTIRIDLLEEV